MTFGELLHACRAKVDFECTNVANLMAQMRNVRLGRHDRRSKAEDFYQKQLGKRKHRGNMSAERLHSLFNVFAQR